jgi:hypothetical protein
MYIGIWLEVDKRATDSLFILPGEKEIQFQNFEDYGAT